MSPTPQRPDSDPADLQAEIPRKRYFKIGEVALLVGVQPHVLRYWEKEVPAIRPGKTTSNQRRYRQRDILLFREIKRLLHEEGYTLAGARRRLQGGGGGKERPLPQARDRIPSSTESAALEAAESTSGPDGHLSGTTVKRAGQLPLGFREKSIEDKLERFREGLRDLVRLAGEEP